MDYSWLWYLDNQAYFEDLFFQIKRFAKSSEGAPRGRGCEMVGRLRAKHQLDPKVQQQALILFCF